MTDMGGLRKKMPITAYTMLIGCFAIIGAGIPILNFGILGLSGFFSKDAIIEQALSHAQVNTISWSWMLFLAPVLGAAITAFYMFRLWYLTFAGEPRDHHRHEHAHESPRVMTVPLIILAIFAVGAGWSLPLISNFSIVNLLEQARPVGTLATTGGELVPDLVIPREHDSHEMHIKMPAGLTAFCMALLGLLLATIVYLWKLVDPARLKTALRPFYEISWHKWWFDELYEIVFVKPTHWIGAFTAGLDREFIDGIIHGLAWSCRQLAVMVDLVGDRTFIDRTVDGLANYTWRGANSLRGVQTGRLRQYVMFIVIGTVVLFLVASIWRRAVAGG